MTGYLFSDISAWISTHGPIAFLGSFLWGLSSVLLSPCAIGSLPLIVAYMAGQSELRSEKSAFIYSLLFSGGLFLALSLVGVACALLGRLLGDVGITLHLLIGLFLVWLGSRLFMQKTCSIPLPFLQKIAVKGGIGAFLVGGTYGIVAGPCTFGFVAPILAVITLGGNLGQGSVMMLMFSLGHCLPLVLAGVSVARLKTYLESRSVFNASLAFQKMAGVLIVLLGAYFAINPIVNAIIGN